MKNLWLFPEKISNDNGYGLIVKQDFINARISSNDITIFFSSKISAESPDSIYIPRDSIISKRRIKNFLKLKHTCDVSINQLEFLSDYNPLEIKDIFCGDVIFYNALRYYFPNKHLTVRFHNCFSRILERKRVLNIATDFAYLFNLYTISKLEQKIFKDINVTLKFLSEEDLQYYTAVVGKENVTLSAVDVNYPPKNTSNDQIEKLIWFGGIESHKKSSLKWFVDQVYIPLKQMYPKLEFHLFGKNTRRFSLKKKDIYGHGFYKGNDFPHKENALYINPDIIGGGVKIKVKSYLENQIRFISSPYGFEGYSSKYIDQKEVIVLQEHLWLDFISSLLKLDS